MEYRNYSGKYYVRLDKDDEVIASLISLCEKENIKVAQIQGIGGCEKAVVGVFDMDKKDYNRETVCGMLEMISLDGNVTEYEGKPYIHAHATFAYHDESGQVRVLTGHLLEAVIGLTGEIILTPADGHITRRFVEDLGIRVWNFE
ncbi:MAG: DUF296 domain-containing protein [Ruminococcus sp.]|nr:DUF296 domain-containing protein [Ruminococcus sp.]MBQ9514830.1 DUF296 domain-containing protein [Ruminococcus sp.]